LPRRSAAKTGGCFPPREAKPFTRPSLPTIVPLCLDDGGSLPMCLAESHSPCKGLTSADCCPAWDGQAKTE
jgi:hypothetical protein